MSLLEPKGKSTRMGTELIKVSKASNILQNTQHHLQPLTWCFASPVALSFQTHWVSWGVFVNRLSETLFRACSAKCSTKNNSKVRCGLFSNGPMLFWTILYALSDELFFTHQVSVYTQTFFKWYCNTCEHLDFMKVLKPNDFNINFSEFHSWNHVANRRWHLVPPAFLAQRWRWDLGLSQPQQCSRPIGAASLFLKDLVDFLEIQIQSYRWMKLM